MRDAAVVRAIVTAAHADLMADDDAAQILADMIDARALAHAIQVAGGGFRHPYFALVADFYDRYKMNQLRAAAYRLWVVNG